METNNRIPKDYKELQKYIINLLKSISDDYYQYGQMDMQHALIEKLNYLFRGAIRHNKPEKAVMIGKLLNDFKKTTIHSLSDTHDKNKK